MAGYTKNFNLKLPSDIEFYDIEDFNENFEKIDQMAVKKGEGIGELTGGALSDRPEPGIAGRYYFAQDTGEIFLDTGEEWVLAAASQKELAAHKADYKQHTSYAIATGNDSYAVSIPGISSLVEGMSVKVKFTSANTGACTLNINGLGAIPIKKSNGNDLSAGNIKAGQILHLVYTGSVFQLLGEGGEYGTAQPEHVLEGYTIGTEEGLKTGTMPNRGAVTNTITTQGGSYTIPAGYHNGSGKVIANFANLVSENIREGVNIGGVVGNVTPASTKGGIIFSRYYGPSPEYNPLGFSGVRYGYIPLGDGPSVSSVPLDMTGLSHVWVYCVNGGRFTLKAGNTVLVNNVTLDDITGGSGAIKNFFKFTPISGSHILTLIGTNNLYDLVIL